MWLLWSLLGSKGTIFMLGTDISSVPVGDVWEKHNTQLVEMSATGSNTILPHISADPSGQCNKAATFKKTIPENIKQLRQLDLMCNCGHTCSLATQNATIWQNFNYCCYKDTLDWRKTHFCLICVFSMRTKSFCSPVCLYYDTQKPHQEWWMLIWQW